MDVTVITDSVDDMNRILFADCEPIEGLLNEIISSALGEEWYIANLPPARESHLSPLILDLRDISTDEWF